eukprot:UN15885
MPKAFDVPLNIRYSSYLNLYIESPFFKTFFVA